MPAPDEPVMHSEAERRYLLVVAREAAGAALNGADYTPPQPPTARLREPGACFVTFKLPHLPPGTGLRGCLGTMKAREPLYLAVARLAADTVTADPRFRDRPVTVEELPQLHIDLSVLHPPRALDDPLDFLLGEDGITVEGRGAWHGHDGVYLPQVATEFKMSAEEFVESCCSHKAGLQKGAWRDPKQCAVYAFRAEVFGE